jgi:hypothetical protein
MHPTGLEEAELKSIYTPYLEITPVHLYLAKIRMLLQATTGFTGQDLLW